MSTVSKFIKKAERKISNVIPHAHSADTRAANAAAKEQMDFYHEQKATLMAESQRVSDERHQEQEKLHKTQIRGLKNKFRGGGGFLGTSGESEIKETTG